MKIRSSRQHLLTAAALTATLAVPSAHASNTWIGTTNVWDTATTANWTSPATWTSGDDAIFTTTGAGIVAIAAGGVTAHNLNIDSGAYTIQGGTLTLSGTTPTITTASGVSTTISSVIDGGAGLTKAGSGTLVLSSASAYTGGTIINGGLLSLSATGTTAGGSAAGLGADPVTVNAGGTLKLWVTTGGTTSYANNLTVNGGTVLGEDGVNTLAGTVTVGASGATFSSQWTNKNLVFSNAISGGDVSVSDVGASQVSRVIFSGENSYGTTTIGPLVTLQIGNAGTSGKLGTGAVTNNGTLTFNRTDAAPVVSNAISGSGALVQAGTGTTTLSGATTYTGNTTVNSGTLALAGSATLASPTITVASGAKFDVSGLTGGDFTVASGKTLVAGRTGTPATDVAGSLTVTGGTLNIAGSGTAGTTTIDGNLTLDGALLPVGHSGVAGDKVSLTGASRALTLTGTTTVSGFMPPGSHILIDGYSSFSGSAANFSYTGSGARGSTGSFTVDGSSVTLNMSAGSSIPLTWSGTPAGAVWDVNTTPNWNANIEKFVPLDDVTFGDNGSNSTVTINGTVFPGSIAFTNSSNTYTVRGGTNPVIAGAGAMTKSGAAQVTLWHPANTYSGGTTISVGTLLLQNSASVATGSYSPLGTGLITINTGAILQVNPSNGGGNIHTFPNALRLNGGMLYHEDGNSVFNGVVTVDLASTIKTRWGTKNTTLAGGLAGSANLTVNDQDAGQGGTVILGADGSYSGTLTINNSAGGNGAVQLNTANALQSAMVTLNTTAAMDGTNARGLILAGAADTNFTIARLSGTQAAAAVHNVNDANTRTLTVNQSGDTTFAGSIGGTSADTQRLNLIKSGAGSLTLTGAQTYTGNTTVNGGTLVMPTRPINAGTGDVTLADGATLGLISTGTPLLIDEIALGTSGANTLAITNFTPNGDTPVIDSLALATNGTTTISVSGTLSTGDSFPQITPLIKYTSRTGAGTFVLAPLPRGVAGGLEDDGDSINLKITGFTSLVWKGTVDSTWDIGTTANWKMGATDPTTYLSGDNVLFDGSATNTTVTLNVPVSPASVSFEFDDPKAYTLGGTGAITGLTGLVKNGTGTLTLATANSFSGATSVNAGSLVLGNASALGNSSGGTTVADGATLELNGFSTAGEAYSLDGSLLNNGGPATASGAISLAGNSVIGGSGNITLFGPVSGSGALEKTGAGTLVLNAAGTYSGGTTVTTGILMVGSNGALGTGNVVVNSGTTLDLNGKTVGAAELIGGIVENTSTTADGGIGNLTLTGGGTIMGTGGRWLSLASTSISGTGDLTIMGNVYQNAPATDLSHTGNLVLSSGQVDTYAKMAFSNGGVVVNGGRLNLNGNLNQTISSLSGTGGTIGLPASGTLTVTINQTSDGTYAGMIDGSRAMIKSGAATLTLAGANTYAGNITVEAGTLHVAPAGRLRFVLGATSGTTNTLGGAGTATLDGGFTIDTTAADGLSAGAWTLESMGATSTYGSGFAVYQADGTTPWTDAGGDTWTKPGAGGRIWTFNEATGTLTLVTAGYDAWAAQIPNEADRDRTDDPDGDGFSNLHEFLFGKNPTVNDGTLVSSTVSGGDLVLRWLQRESGTTYTLMESTSLGAGSWVTSGMIPQSDVQPGDPADYDQWKAVIPLGSGKIFFRIEGLENTP
jgi:fibronectin-binding autotransporter adhesin